MVRWPMAGRYVDGFEKRDGEWRVAERTAVFDWVEETLLPPGTEVERFGRRRGVSPRPCL